MLLILMRGLPGSGKSTTAKDIKSKCFDPSSAMILSTDDYWIQGMNEGEDPVTVYKQNFNPKLISQAHMWNFSRFTKALKKKVYTIIIDNTNCTAWEMENYVKEAIINHYGIEIREPESELWQDIVCSCLLGLKTENLDATQLGMLKELEQRNSHGASLATIKKMAAKWEHIDINAFVGENYRKMYNF